jgi:UV DNA damage endonuclease
VDREDPVIRWGLCCQFLDSPITFRAATHRYVASLESRVARRYLSEIARHNAQALIAAVERCHQLGIGAFRITSQILPLATHPVSGYLLERLDPSGEIDTTFHLAADLAREYDIRLSFHPDQFVVLNSMNERVVHASVAELELQAMIAEMIGADVIVLHGGGAAGGVDAAVERLERGLELLSPRARQRLALENDDRCFTPRSLLPLCQRSGVPLVYDVHHHRCLEDGLSVEEATELAAETWHGREQYCHLSSPKGGWEGPNIRAHADYIDPADFPDAWRARAMTVDVEAKAKERAVLALKDALATYPAAGPRTRIRTRASAPGAAP